MHIQAATVLPGNRWTAGPRRCPRSPKRRGLTSLVVIEFATRESLVTMPLMQYQMEECCESSFSQATSLWMRWPMAPHRFFSGVSWAGHFLITPTCFVAAGLAIKALPARFWQAWPCFPADPAETWTAPGTCDRSSDSNTVG